MEYGLVAVWLIAYLALGALGLPIAAVLFRGLSDRGAGVAIPLSLTVVTMVVLWIGHLSFGPVTLGVALLVLIAASGSAVRFGTVDPDWRVAGETAVVFAAAFLFMVAVRAVDPAVHPLLGEKFLDFGMVKTILRADALPPEDFWFAGQPVAYYYGGHLSASLLAILTDTAGKYAYNLALAGYYAIFVTGAFGLGGALADARGASRRTGGALAAFLVGVASNLEPAARVLADVLPGGLVRGVVGAFVASPGDVLGSGGFSYWGASRVIPGTINEFPLFAWLNGDLHGHMMSPSFMLVLLVALFAYFRTGEGATRRRRLLVFGAVPFVGGLLAVVNTWSFPSVMGLAALALLFGEAHPATLLPDQLGDRLAPSGGWIRREAGRVVVAGGLAVCVELLAAVWALPFFLGPASTRGIGIVSGQSGLGVLLLVHGAFLAVGTLYLVDRTPFETREDLLQALLLGVGGVTITAALGVAAVGLFVPFIAGGWILLRSDADVGFETVIFVAGVGLALLVEFVYVIENAGPGRFNTVFKLYAQVWAFLAISSGAMLATLLASSRRRPSLPVGSASLDRRVAVLAVVAVLLVSTSLYAGLALSKHFAGESMYARYQTVENPTLDAVQFVETGHPEEAPAIYWMEQNVEGQPNIVTAAPAGYFWGPNRRGEIGGAAAPASLTGIPTVAGWHHAADFQGREAYWRRVEDVRTIYTGSPKRQARLLRTYDVEYVYFGPAERDRYGGLDAGATIDDLRGIEVLKRWGSVRIFRVRQSELPG